MEIIYEPHPVTPERKAELREAGFKIIDAKFAPPETQAKDKSKPRRARKDAE